jgi:hypothetical protein
MLVSCVYLLMLSASCIPHTCLVFASVLHRAFMLTNACAVMDATPSHMATRRYNASLRGFPSWDKEGLKVTLCSPKRPDHTSVHAALFFSNLQAPPLLMWMRRLHDHCCAYWTEPDALPTLGHVKRPHVGPSVPGNLR